MDFEIEAHQRQFRDQIRHLIAEHVDDAVIYETHTTGTNHAPALHRALGTRGVLARATPGRDKDPVELWLLASEMEIAEAPFDSIGMVLAIAGVINAIGSDHQKETVGTALAAGEDLVCFGLTEPDGGSDLAAMRTRAERDGDEWVINGAKMWTTMAHVADWVFLMTRTDATGGRFDGFTVFIVPMTTPGITVDPVPTLSTERSNATFYDDVRVGSEWVVGEVGKGWDVLSVMLGFERGMGNTGFLTPLLRRVARWVDDVSGGDPDRVLDRVPDREVDREVRAQMAQIAIDAQICELLTQRTVWTAAIGRPPAAEGSISKVFATEAYVRHARWAQAIAAPESLLGFDERGAAGDGWIDHDVRHSVPQPIQGGTNEINRNNIAERHLGLPRYR